LHRMGFPWKNGGFTMKILGIPWGKMVWWDLIGPIDDPIWSNSQTRGSTGIFKIKWINQLRFYLLLLGRCDTPWIFLTLPYHVGFYANPPETNFEVIHLNLYF
jgi:hypothetical protein